MLEDKLLVWKLRRGRLDALRQIYDKYKIDLLKLAVALTGDVCQAEDVVQDVFLKLVQSHDRIDIRHNLKSYLTTCLVNRIRSLRRRGQCHGEVPVDQPPDEVSEANRPDRWAVVNDQMRQIGEAMAQLSPEQREVVTLRFEAGLGFRQIARIQGASMYTVQGRYRYGMEKLRSLLNSEAEE